jgi:hypothetical protein
MGRIDVEQLQCDLQTSEAEFNKWAGDLMDTLESLHSEHSEALREGAGLEPY